MMNFEIDGEVWSGAAVAGAGLEEIKLYDLKKHVRGLMGELSEVEEREIFELGMARLKRERRASRRGLVINS